MMASLYLLSIRLSQPISPRHEVLLLQAHNHKNQILFLCINPTTYSQTFPQRYVQVDEGVKYLFTAIKKS